MNIRTLYSAQCTLGESPFWHAGRQSYFWVDIEKGLLHELDSAAQRFETWELNSRVSLIIGNNDGRLVLALQGKLAIFNPADGRLKPLLDIESDKADNRCNDGACDSRGRIWVGTMEVHCKDNAGSLYCIDTELKIKKKIDKLTIPNGLVWSLDNERMYFIETTSRGVKSYFFNKQSGEIYFEKVAVCIPDEMGYPDGMTIDADGMLWIALYGGGAVTRWNPATGTLLQRIDLPAPHITNCCFAGKNLNQLVVTSARENLTDEQLSNYPESGNVFIIENVGTVGVKSCESKFNNHN